MLKIILVLLVIVYLGLSAANNKETEWISWILAVIAIGTLSIIYSVFMKPWACCFFAYQPEFPQKN